MANSDSFYQEIVQDVEDVLDALGTSFLVQAEGSSDPGTLTTTPGASRQVTGVVADQQAALAIAGTGGATWVAKKILILSAAANPVPGEKVQVGGEWFSLDKVVAIKPAEITVMYLLDLVK